MAGRTQIILLGISLLLAFAFGALLFSAKGAEEVAYYRGRASKAEEALQQASETFTKALKEEKRIQEEKDKQIKTLKTQIAEHEKDLTKLGEALGQTREQLVEAGKYEGLVLTLDKQWQERYTKLEDVSAKKDQVIQVWQEKFETKVNLAIQAYATKVAAQEEVIQDLKGQISALTREHANAKGWALVGKVLTVYTTCRTGYDLLKGRL